MLPYWPLFGTWYIGFSEEAYCTKATSRAAVKGAGLVDRGAGGPFVSEGDVGADGGGVLGQWIWWSVDWTVDY